MGYNTVNLFASGINTWSDFVLNSSHSFVTFENKLIRDDLFNPTGCKLPC